MTQYGHNLGFIDELFRQYQAVEQALTGDLDVQVGVRRPNDD